MFDLSFLVDLVRDHPATASLVGTGTIGGGLGLFFRARRSQARRAGREISVAALEGSLPGQLVGAIDQFVKNREVAKRRFEVLKQTVECQDADRRKDIADLERVWTLAETQQALNARFAAELEMPNRPELESAGQNPPPPNRRSRQGRRR